MIDHTKTTSPSRLSRAALVLTVAGTAMLIIGAIGYGWCWRLVHQLSGHSTVIGSGDALTDRLGSQLIALAQISMTLICVGLLAIGVAGTMRQFVSNRSSA